ncbi:MBL fold metallo-hydrolase [Vibrio pectenicida]|uniref:MBL fold metallo-hydrolase n=1 Tax=Vibrio pectenicida TaxID=62763 RepID=UPI001FE66236|nr:MBL fold metallo-hydrolase [Vibrio pectenicida]
MTTEIEQGYRAIFVVIVFDTGNGRTFCDNARLLDVDIAEVGLVVLSHRHHDHCNGTSHFIEINGKAKIYMRACEDQNYYFQAFGIRTSVGMDKAILERNSHRIEFIKNTTEIAPNIYIVTQIDKKYPQPLGNQYLYTQSKTGFERDKFNHELILVIKEKDGLVVFTGCAHSGVLNMVETVVNLFPEQKIKAVVGGFHLVGLPVFNSIDGSKQGIEVIGQVLAEYPIDKFYIGHYTGMKAYAILKQVLSDRLEHIPTGRSVYL